MAQGWKLTSENVTSFLSLLKSRFDEITVAVARVTAVANDELEDKRKNKDSLNLDALFEDEEQSSSSLSIPADVAMVNMYRSGLLSLQLLPPQSNAGLVLISDGMLTLPNASVLESMLTQSRNHNISCSFLQVGSSPHPHACFGYLPYTDLMKFITTATFGAYLDKCPDEPEVCTSIVPSQMSSNRLSFHLSYDSRKNSTTRFTTELFWPGTFSEDCMASSQTFTGISIVITTDGL